jgi:ABC-type transport system substrate-binding protein
MKEPDQFMFDTLASEFALIQAPEAVRDFAGDWRKLDSDHVIGTGPWAFDWADDGVKFTAARGGHREAQLDELFLTEPHDNAQRFIDGALDETIAFDRREAAEIVANTKATFDEYRRPAREIVMSTFFIGVPPWNNLELVTAISSALARSELVETLFGGRASAVRGVPLSVVGTRVSDTLEGLPGDIPGPDASYFGARQRWEAAGGPGLGTVTVDFPSVFDPLYSASSVVVDQLNRVLGAQFRPAVETYTTISKRVLDGHYGNGRAAFWFGWGPPLSSASASSYYSELYAPSSAAQRSVGGRGGDGGASGARKLTTQGYLGIVPWVQQYNEVYRLRSKAGPFPSPFWQQHMDYTRRNA